MATVGVPLVLTTCNSTTHDNVLHGDQGTGARITAGIQEADLETGGGR